VVKLDDRYEIKKLPLFTTPIYNSKINPTLYNKKGIVKTILSNFKKNKVRNNWDNTNPSSSYLHHPLDDFNNKKFTRVDFSTLLPLYNSFFQTCFKDIVFQKGKKKDFEFKIVNYTVCDKEHFMRKHNHITSDFSCIHYVYFEPNHSHTLFYNPGEYLLLHFKDLRNSFYNDLDHTKITNSGYHQMFQVPTKEDDIMLFPGYLHHEIPLAKTKYKKPRITIVINLKFNEAIL